MRTKTAATVLAAATAAGLAVAIPAQAASDAQPAWIQQLVGGTEVGSAQEESSHEVNRRGNDRQSQAPNTLEEGQAPSLLQRGFEELPRSAPGVQEEQLTGNPENPIDQDGEGRD